ncbi:bifunctional Gfo/Idh/MocA family oxidoreductase/class I SAM-dependent methyltransferase [Lysobacter sp. CA199]|uniref:bifunctional Gfo/Idh/MocA family oxidoreductase/class I SAM-dependent methyltransferase n=1 Tax=Lysobacter sp. CA199 TaxID=3455608 RepID=UPI003F8D35DF
MSATRSLLLCGDGFGEAQFAALSSQRMRLRVVARKMHDCNSADVAVQPTDPSLSTDSVHGSETTDAVWIGADCVDAGTLVLNALRQGRAVLCDAGLTQQELAECVRVARGGRAPLRFGGAVTRLPAVRRMSACVRLLRPRLRAIQAECDRSRLPVLMDVLGSALGTLRPWRFRVATDDDGIRWIHGELAGVPLRLHVRDAVSHLRLTLDSLDGELRLIDAHGPLRWTPRDAGSPLDLGDPTHADPLAEWAEAIGSDLHELLAVLDSSGAPLPSDLAQRLALAQLLQELQALLGDSNTSVVTADAGDPVDAAQLQTAALAAGNDDELRERGEIVHSDSVHAAGLKALHARLPGRAAALDGCAALLRELEAISLAAQARVLYDSGALREGEERDAATLIKATSTAPRHAWLLRRWLAALTETGALQQRGETYRWLRRPPAVAPATIAPMLGEVYAQLGFPLAMTHFHNAALARLETLLRDDLQVQELLFAQADPIAALAAYQDNPFTAYANAAAAELLRQCPARGAALRVIELGGGPGMSTDAALTALAGRDIDYLFSDVSRMFTLAAQQRYAGRGDLRYGLLDLDADFAAQGIAPRSADVVLAGNVLHNAADIGRSLRRIRRSLAPGGWLVFTESLADNRAVLTSMQFLLSPADGAELPGTSDVRAASGTVFLDTPGWHEALIAAGFRPRLRLPADPQSPMAAAGQSLFFATACL